MLYLFLSFINNSLSHLLPKINAAGKLEAKHLIAVALCDNLSDHPHYCGAICDVCRCDGVDVMGCV